MTTSFFSPSYVQRRDPLARTIDDLLQGFLVRPVSAVPTAKVRGFKIDVREEGNSYLVEADLPGLKKDDIKIEIDGAQVSISAEYKSEATRKEGESPVAGDGARVVYTERSVGAVGRSFELPAEIDQAAASAKYEDGVLKLTLPKKVAETRKLLAIH
jgi:HSP20 family protein